MTIKELWLFSAVLVLETLIALAVVSKPDGIVEQYNVSMVNSGPAFYGSNLTFSAQLLSGTSQVPQESNYFRYEWWSSADGLTKTQNANFNTTLTRCYGLTDPGTYQMSLRVFNKARMRRELVASSTQNFTLTEHLNGKLSCSQGERFISAGQAFSTEKPVQVKLDITDKFSKDPEYRYEWTLVDSNSSTTSTTFPFHQFTLAFPGTHTIKVKVTSQTSVENCGDVYDAKPRGDFETNVQMFVPIRGVQIVGKNSVRNNTFVIEEVYFNGSAPFNITWSVVNTTSNHQTVASGMIQNMNGSSPIKIQLNRTLHQGSYDFRVTVRNAVSKQDKHHNFTVSEGDNPTHSAAVIVLPLIGSLVLVTLFVVALYVAVPRWKRKHVETADFDFHPTLQLPSNTEQTQNTGVLRAIYNKLFCKTERNCDTRKKSMHRIGIYGSMDASVAT